MSILIPLLIIALIGILFFVYYFWKKGQNEAQFLVRQNQEILLRQHKAVWARGIVLNVHGGLMGESSTTRLTLSLEVTPSDGIAYRASAIWLVDISAIGNIQPGQEISLKIDAQDPTLIYPNIKGAVYLGK